MAQPHLNNEDNYLELRFNEKEPMMKYPYIWLRDNCECTDCRYVTFGRQRKTNPLDLDVCVTVTQSQLSADGKSLEVIFSDGHRSSFCKDWLKKNAFTTERRKKLRRGDKMAPVAWGKEMEGNVPELDYTKVLHDDEVFLQLARELEEKGIVAVTGAPKEHGVLEAITDRMGGISSHNLEGKPDCMQFYVDKDVNFDLLAYSNSYLPLHTDHAYSISHPLIEMLHSIAQPTEGTVNNFVDGRKATDVLRSLDPEALRLMSSVDVQYGVKYDGAKTRRAEMAQPIIRLDADGDFLNINYSNELRMAGLAARVEDVSPFYKAFQLLFTIIKDNTIGRMTREGEVIVFDNNRLMHGRDAFPLTANSHRHLETVYVDIDTLQSTKMAMLEKQKNGRI